MNIRGKNGWNALWERLFRYYASQPPEHCGLMEIGARLHHLHLLSPQPEALAQFYSRAYGMRAEASGSVWICSAPNRRLVIGEGPVNRLAYFAFAFANEAAIDAQRQRVASHASIGANLSPLFDQRAFSVVDPHGNSVVFGVGSSTPSLAAAPATSPAPSPIRLQHFALRSTQPSDLLPFYRDVLGFVVSDRVQDDTGRLRACFLRTDNEHHALAIFDASTAQHDHLSFEAPDWTALRDWADRMGALKEPIVWGVGRHGPGNDVFFMVRDPDGNLAEISAEIEVCAPGRPEGLWPHEQRTLNLWGMALMRT